MHRAVDQSQQRATNSLQNCQQQHRGERHVGDRRQVGSAGTQREAEPDRRQPGLAHGAGGNGGIEFGRQNGVQASSNSPAAPSSSSGRPHQPGGTAADENNSRSMR